MRANNKRELYTKILTIVFAFLFAAWLPVVYTAMTGLTFATRSRRGRVAHEDDRTRVRHIAILVTVVALPVGLWAEMKRRQHGVAGDQ